jgi:hypothetical protein
LKQIEEDAGKKKAKQVVKNIESKVDKKLSLENQEVAEVESTDKKMNYLPIILGGGLLLYFVSRKK